MNAERNKTVKKWTAEEISGLVRGFQPACVLAAGAELGVFDALAEKPLTAEKLAKRIQANLRATTMLADALVAMGLLGKQGDSYGNAPGIAETLTANGKQSTLATVRHLGNCLRSWAKLAEVVKTGRPADRRPSIRGAEADQEAFIEAMNEISRSIADSLVKAIGPLQFKHLLDVGGGPGTWTIAFLRAYPQARATLFDLPEVIPIARRHIVEAGLQGRVKLVTGDFAVDPTLPVGADLAWVSAIVHMNSRQQNRDLFAKVRTALADGGQILIRDVVMDDSHTQPVQGAMFAINMLVNTEGGGTFSFAELSEDLRATGFSKPSLLRQGEMMDSVVRARKS